MLSLLYMNAQGDSSWSVSMQAWTRTEILMESSVRFLLRKPICNCILNYDTPCRPLAFFDFLLGILNGNGWCGVFSCKKSLACCKGFWSRGSCALFSYSLSRSVCRSVLPCMGLPVSWSMTIKVKPGYSKRKIL